MAGRSARSSRTAPRKFRFSSASHWSSVMTANPPGGVDEPPTTWTTMSSLPFSAMRAATASAPSVVDVSASMKRSGRSYLGHRPRGRPDVGTIARSLSTTALPEPFEPPVTSACDRRDDRVLHVTCLLLDLMVSVLNRSRRVGRVLDLLCQWGRNWLDAAKFTLIRGPVGVVCLGTQCRQSLDSGRRGREVACHWAERYARTTPGRPDRSAGRAEAQHRDYALTPARRRAITMPTGAVTVVAVEVEPQAVVGHAVACRRRPRHCLERQGRGRQIRGTPQSGAARAPTGCTSSAGAAPPSRPRELVEGTADAGEPAGHVLDPRVRVEAHAVSSRTSRPRCVRQHHRPHRRTGEQRRSWGRSGQWASSAQLRRSHAARAAMAS